MIGKNIVLYLCTVGLFGILLMFWSRIKILSILARIRRRVKKLKNFESIKTSTPVDDPVGDSKETAVESVEKRFSIIGKISFYLIVVIWITALLFPFLDGIPAAMVSFFVGTAGIVIGIAARPFIENLISGIVISFSNLIRIGDTVLIDDKYGTIEDITITHTVVKIWNWRRYIIPNSRMLAKEIMNCTINDKYQWAHVVFFLAYDNDVQLVRKMAIDAAMKSKYFAAHEEPRFWIMSMDEKGYKCWIAAWADSPIDAWELGSDIRTELIQQFKSNGIKTHKFELNCSGDDD